MQLYPCLLQGKGFQYSQAHFIGECTSMSKYNLCQSSSLRLTLIQHDPCSLVTCWSKVHIITHQERQAVLLEVHHTSVSVSESHTDSNTNNSMCSSSKLEVKGLPFASSWQTQFPAGKGRVSVYPSLSVYKSHAWRLSARASPPTLSPLLTQHWFHHHSHFAMGLISEQRTCLLMHGAKMCWWKLQYVLIEDSIWKLKHSACVECLFTDLLMVHVNCFTCSNWYKCENCYDFPNVCVCIQIHFSSIHSKYMHSHILKLKNAPLQTVSPRVKVLHRQFKNAVCSQSTQVLNSSCANHTWASCCLSTACMPLTG